jgi:hypothetical protein
MSRSIRLLFGSEALNPIVSTSPHCLRTKKADGSAHQGLETIAMVETLNFLAEDKKQTSRAAFQLAKVSFSFI